MEKIDILLWVISGGFSLMLVMWHFMNSKMEKGFDGVSEEIKGIRQEIKEVRQEIKEVEREMHNIDKRLCKIEGILYTQDCCVLKEDRQMKKAE